MEQSPNNHDIEKLSGEGPVIYQRGVDMENLGIQMRESADILEKIKNGTEGKGYSVEKIKDNVNSLHTDLREAGERYEPSGAVVKNYGDALTSVQSTISTIVDNCESLWTAYQTAVGNLSDATSATIPDDETPEAKLIRETAEEDLGGSKQAAYDAWYEEAKLYDIPYETWDDAYEAAVTGLKDANDNGVEDSWWDDQLPWIEVALNILAVVGVVLAVAALIIGGPIIAALAAIVAIVTLALTIWKVAAGRGNGWDIVVAVIGVIPFGRLAQLGPVFKGVTPFTSFMKGFGSDMIGLTGFLNMRSAAGLPGIIARTPITNSAGNLTQSQNIIDGITSVGDDIADLSRFGDFNPAAMWSRAAGGSGDDMAQGMASAFGRESTNVGNHVDTMLEGSSIHGMQNPLSIIEQGGNLIDTVAKPGYELSEIVGGMTSSDPTSTWEQELASSR